MGRPGIRELVGRAMIEKEFGPRWQLITGARAEYSDVLVKAVPTFVHHPIPRHEDAEFKTLIGKIFG